MGEFLDFQTNPQFVSAFRFMLWASFLSVSVLAWARIRLSDGVARQPRVGVAMVFSGLTVHQFYYWLRWRAEAHEDVAILAALSEIRHITSLCLIVMSIGALLYLGWWLRDRWGPFWLPIGGSILGALFAVGYGDALWL